MEFRVLGPLEAVIDGESVGLGTPCQRALLGLLLIRAGEAVTLDRLAEDLWDGEPPGTARHTVQGYVHRLRRAFGEAAWRLVTTTHGYQLKASADELDAQRFQHLAEEARRALVRGDPELGADLLDEALSLWRGPLLADLPDLVAIEPERARLDALRLTALEDQVEAELALGGHAALSGRLERLVTEHPFRERLHGQLMLALYRSRRQADALQGYDRACRLLGEELGIDPSPWLRRLQQQILVQDPTLDARESRHAPRARHNLPTQRTTFVGRRHELAELEGLLRTRRLVCVTGAAGSGKTRLAVEVAAALVEEFSHGVFFVSLAELEDPELVPAAIATSLGVAPGDQTAMQALARHLESRRVLLLLDNFEHVIAAAAQVGHLLDAAPAVTVLATSRAPLRLSGEQEFPIEPLPVPGAEELAADPSGHDALELFTDRALAVDPRFVLDHASAAMVAEVAARLDGLPLAIELAAARLRSLPLEELRRRLDPALPLLTRGPVDQSGRQQTLRDAIAWSENLLDPADRTLFRRLGVFRGGFTIEAAEAIASDIGAIEERVGRGLGYFS